MTQQRVSICHRRRHLAAGISLALLLCAGCTSFAPLEPQHPRAQDFAAQHEAGGYILYTDTDPKVCNNPDDHVLASVIRIATGDGGDASGVVVADGRVLTAAHVVHDSGITLARVGDSYREATVLAMDHGADLALLSVDTGSLRPLPLSHKTLYNYEQVWAIGYPLALDQVTTHGFFRNESQGRLFTSAPIDAGASGGGLIRCENGNFELAGLIRGYGAYRIGDELIPLHDLSIHTPAALIQQFVYQIEGMRL